MEQYDQGLATLTSGHDEWYRLWNQKQQLSLKSLLDLKQGSQGACWAPEQTFSLGQEAALGTPPSSC